jgi:hypothetical protein
MVLRLTVFDCTKFDTGIEEPVNNKPLALSTVAKEYVPFKVPSFLLPDMSNMVEPPE